MELCGWKTQRCHFKILLHVAFINVSLVYLLKQRAAPHDVMFYSETFRLLLGSGASSDPQQNQLPVMVFYFGWARRRTAAIVELLEVSIESASWASGEAFYSWHTHWSLFSGCEPSWSTCSARKPSESSDFSEFRDRQCDWSWKYIFSNKMTQINVTELM